MDRAIEQAITRPRPVWLTEQEVDLEHDPAVVPTAPAPAIAYVRFHEAAGLRGFDTSAYSIGYIAGWSGEDVTVIRDSAARVLAAAHNILGMLEK